MLDTEDASKSSAVFASSTRDYPDTATADTTAICAAKSPARHLLIRLSIPCAPLNSVCLLPKLDVHIIPAYSNLVTSIEELIVQYSDNFNIYLARLFGIPEIKKIKYLENGIFVYVDPDYIGLVIGKDGSNIKLVRMLLNKHIDVFKYSDFLDSNNVSPVES